MIVDVVMGTIVGVVLCGAGLLLGVWLFDRLEKWIERIAYRTTGSFSTTPLWSAQQAAESRLIELGKENKELKAHFRGMQSTNDKRDHRLRHRMWELEKELRRAQQQYTTCQDDINKMVLKTLEHEARIEEVRENGYKPDRTGKGIAVVGSDRDIASPGGVWGT